MLRALQESRITRVGDNKEIKVDVRVLAATNKNLRDEIEAGRFREDLYHRIAVIVVKVPSLNQRRDDIPADRTLQPPHQRRLRASAKNFNPQAIRAMQEYNWTGNIRELANVVERLLILCDQSVRMKMCGSMCFRITNAFLHTSGSYDTRLQSAGWFLLPLVGIRANCFMASSA